MVVGDWHGMRYGPKDGGRHAELAQGDKLLRLLPCCKLWAPEPLKQPIT